MLSMGPSGLAKERACAAILITFAPWPYRAVLQGQREVHTRHCTCTKLHMHAAHACKPSPYVHGLGLDNNGCVLQSCV